MNSKKEWMNVGKSEIMTGGWMEIRKEWMKE